MTRAIQHIALLLAMCLAGGSAWAESVETEDGQTSGSPMYSSAESEVRDNDYPEMVATPTVRIHGDNDSNGDSQLALPLLTSYLPIVFASGAETSAEGPVYAPIDTLPPESSESPSEVQPELQLRDLYCLTDVDGVTNCEDVTLLPPQSDTYFWYGVEHIGWCESKYRVWVISRTQDYGLMQIHFPTHTARINRLGYGWENMLEFAPNLWAAYDLYLEQGQSFRAWSCARIVGME